MKILVTGGAGFIGSHLVEKLLKENHTVIVIDNLSTGKRENLNLKTQFYEIDIRDSKVSQIFEKEKPQAVFHYAAQTDVQKSVENSIKDADINILGTLNILENCKKYKVKKFIFASSAGVYGNTPELPIKESYSQNPISPYPATKLSIEKYLNYYKGRGIDPVSLRHSNVYGPRQLSEGEGGVVAIFIDKLLRGEKPIIFGSGQQTRDFLYVEDAVEAAVKALKSQSALIYNIGTNKETNINNLLELIFSELDIRIKPIFLPSRQGDVIRSRVDFSKARKGLNWHPKYDLKEGLKKTISFFKNINEK